MQEVQSKISRSLQQINKLEREQKPSKTIDSRQGMMSSEPDFSRIESKNSTLNNYLSNFTNKLNSMTLKNDSSIMDKLSKNNAELISKVTEILDTFMDKILDMLERKIDYYEKIEKHVIEQCDNIPFSFRRGDNLQKSPSPPNIKHQSYQDASLYVSNDYDYSDNKKINHSLPGKQSELSFADFNETSKNNTQNSPTLPLPNNRSLEQNLPSPQKLWEQTQLSLQLSQQKQDSRRPSREQAVMTDININPLQ